MITERIEQDGDRIIPRHHRDPREVVHGHDAIALQHTRDDPVRVRVEGTDGHVEIRVVVGDADLSTLGGRLTGQRFTLTQARRHLCSRPEEFVDRAVDLNLQVRLGQAKCLHRRGGGLLPARKSGRDEQQPESDLRYGELPSHEASVELQTYVRHRNDTTYSWDGSRRVTPCSKVCTEALS